MEKHVTWFFRAFAVGVLPPWTTELSKLTKQNTG